MADNTQLAAMTGGDVCATDDVGGVKHQRVKVEFGPDGSATDVAPGAGLPVAGAYVELTGSASANATDLIASTDVRAYRSLSMMLTGTFSATVQVQGSNDGTNWSYVPLVQVGGTTNPALQSIFSTPSIQFAGPISSRYLRVRTTAYTSGTVTAIVELGTYTPSYPVVGIAGNPSVAAAPSAQTPSGDATSSTLNGVGGYVYNGTTWDRVRNVTAVDGTGSTGLLAAGLVGYDAAAAINRRAQVDANGSQLIAGGFKELTGSASANNTDLFSADVSQYRWASIHITGTFAATVSFQFSNDNVNWINANSFYDATSNNPARAFLTSTTGKLFVGYLNARYFRVRCTSYGSGTVTAVAELSPFPGNHASVNIETVTTPVQVASGLDAGDANPVSRNYQVAVAPHVFNGSTFDRVRGANAAANATGTGLVGAGNLGYDGTNWQRLKTSTAGELQTNQAGATTSAVTSVAGSATSVSLLAANAARKQATVYNESTANLYLKLGATASITSYTVKITAGGYYELPRSGYTGAVDGIWDAANGNARITELT